MSSMNDAPDFNKYLSYRRLVRTANALASQNWNGQLAQMKRDALRQFGRDRLYVKGDTKFGSGATSINLVPDRHVERVYDKDVKTARHAAFLYEQSLRQKSLTHGLAMDELENLERALQSGSQELIDEFEGLFVYTAQDLPDNDEVIRLYRHVKGQ